MKKDNLQWGAWKHSSRLAPGYTRAIDSYPLLSRAEELEYAKKSCSGDLSARHVLLVSNLRFVRMVANRMSKYLPDIATVTTEDLFQWGVIGLMKSIEQYEPREDVKLTSYAVKGIFRQITLGIARNGMAVGLSPTRWRTIRKFQQYVPPDDLPIPLEDLPPEDVARYLGTSPKQAEATKYLSAALNTIRLNDLASFERNMVEHPLPDEDAYEPDALIANKEQKLILENRIKERLHGNPRVVIEEYFGFNGYEEKSLRDIGQEIGITQQAVNRLRKSAIKKFMSDPVVRELRFPDERAKHALEEFYRNKIRERVIKEQAQRLGIRKPVVKKTAVQRTVAKISGARHTIKTRPSPPTTVLKMSRMDEVTVNLFDMESFVRTYLSYYGYTEQNPLTQRWLLPDIRGPLVYLLLERNVEMWAIEKATGLNSPETLMQERNAVVRRLRKNRDYLKPLRTWLEEHYHHSEKPG